MEIVFIIISGIFIFLGIVGSFLPVLPGPPTSWLGFLILYFTTSVEVSLSFLLITLLIALFIFFLDSIISVLGVKKMGGGRAGMIGSSLGLIIGILFMGPLGIIIGPFVGAFLGELIANNNTTEGAIKTATGALLGFLSGVFLKFIVSIAFAFYYVEMVWNTFF